MEDNKPIDGAEYISLEDARRLKLPYFEGLAAGYPSPAGDYQHESLDLNEKNRERLRAEGLATYAKKNGLAVTMYQDYGWPAKN